MPKTILFFGCGGHARSVADIYLNEHPENQIVFVDEAAKADEKIFGFPILQEKPSGNSPRFFAIGDNVKRLYISQVIGNENLISIISSKAYLGLGSSWGAGTFIGNFCHLGPNVKIGLNCIINNGAIVEHEVLVGDYSHIGPGAVISGRSKIGDLVFVGVGAAIKDGLDVCSNVIIGAGATVVKSIFEPGVYVGCPALKIKEFPYVHASLR